MHIRIVIAAAAFVAAAALALAAVTARPVLANPAVAKSTGQPCAKCHTAPPAPGLNTYGKKFKEGMKK